MTTGTANSSASCTVGVSDHWGWAVVVAVDGKGEVLDRRRVELLDSNLPRYPYHHDAQGLPLPAAEAMIAAVTASVEQHAARLYEELATSLPLPITAIALRQCPALPLTIAERLSDYFAQNNADSVLYRQALAKVAQQRQWNVQWFSSKTVFAEAAAKLGTRDMDTHMLTLKKKLGSPWNKDHQLALAAALAANSVSR